MIRTLHGVRGIMGDYDMGRYLHNNVLIRALCVGLLCGFAGMVIDVDHIPYYIFHIVVQPLVVIPGLFDQTSFANGRPLHPLVLYISGSTLACTGGLLLQHSVRIAAKNAFVAVFNAIRTIPVPK